MTGTASPDPTPSTPPPPPPHPSSNHPSPAPGSPSSPCNPDDRHGLDILEPQQQAQEQPAAVPTEPRDDASAAAPCDDPPRVHEPDRTVEDEERPAKRRKTQTRESPPWKRV